MYKFYTTYLSQYLGNIVCIIFRIELNFRSIPQESYMYDSAGGLGSLERHIAFTCRQIVKLLVENIVVYCTDGKYSMRNGTINASHLAKLLLTYSLPSSKKILAVFQELPVCFTSQAAIAPYVAFLFLRVFMDTSILVTFPCKFSHNANSRYQVLLPYV